MKTLANITLAMLLSIALFPCFGQKAVQVDYMYVKPENVDYYLEIEEQWKDLHQQRIRDGVITGWLLYEVMFTGANDSYNYVTVTYFNDFADMEAPFPDGLFEKVYGDKDMDEFLERTNESRDMVYSRAFHNVASLPPEKGPSKFLSVNAFNIKTGKQGTYEHLEKQVWQPMHQQALKNDKINSWDIWYMYPNPGDDYQYIEVEGFMSMRDNYNYNENYNDFFEEAHPDKDVESSMQQSQDTRQQVKSWVWRLVDYSWPEPQ